MCMFSPNPYVSPSHTDRCTKRYTLVHTHVGICTYITVARNKFERSEQVGLIYFTDASVTGGHMFLYLYIVSVLHYLLLPLSLSIDQVSLSLPFALSPRDPERTRPHPTARVASAAAGRSGGTLVSGI